MLINALRDEKPTQIAVALELDEKTFQHEQYVEYKANGADAGRLPEPAQPDLRRARRARHPAAAGAGYEADDLSATPTTQASAEDMDVLTRLNAAPRPVARKDAATAGGGSGSFHRQAGV